MHHRDREQNLNDWLSRHKGLLIKVARSFAQSVHDRDDLLQEIVFQVWKSIPGYKPDVAESTWLYRVALYTAINWSRKESAREKQMRELSERLGRAWLQVIGASRQLYRSLPA